jgi:hypothetical protein
MDTLKQFYLDNREKLRFVNSVDKKVVIVPKFGKPYGFEKWKEKTSKENYNLDDFLIPDEIKTSKNMGYGLICGEQLDGSYIMCFDFDINSIKHNQTKHNPQLEELFETLTRNNLDGVFQSSTKDNYQMLINVKDKKYLEYINTIKHHDKDKNLDKFSVQEDQYYEGLEFFFNTHTVLPPSKTLCKTTKKYRKRMFLSNKFIREMDDELFLVMKNEYENYIGQKHIASSKKQKKTHKKNFIESTQEEITNITTTEKSKIEQMCDIINLKYIDAYNDWFQLVYALKSYNLKEIAINISKKSKKFEDADNQFDRLWNDNNKDSIGKVFIYARISDEEKYNKILDDFRKNKNKNLLLNLYDRNNFKKYVNYIQKESKYVDWELIKDGRIIFIDSAMGTGKTYAIKNYIKYFEKKIKQDHIDWQKHLKKYNNYVYQQSQENKVNEMEKYFVKKKLKQMLPVEEPKEEPKTTYRILAISSRKSFAAFICQELNITNYIECEAPYKEDKLCVQLESLYKIYNYKYDLVLLDEIESILKQFSSTTMIEKYKKTFDSLDYILKKAGKIICADAFISLRSIEFMHYYSDYYNTQNNKNQLIKYIHNPIKKDQYKVNVIQYNKKGLNKAIEHILKLISEGKNVFAPSSNKSFITSLENNIPKDLKEYCKFYHSETDKRQDAIDIKDANKIWQTLKLLSCSPTFTNGISFAPKHFDYTVQFVSNTSCCSRDLFQQLLRVRHLKSKHIYIYVESEKVLNKKLGETIYENYEDFYTNFISEKKKEFENDLAKLQDRGITISSIDYLIETPSILSQIIFYNQLEDGLSKKAFIENMKLFMGKCNYDFTIEQLVIEDDKQLKKTNQSDDELNLLYEYYEKLDDLTQDQLEYFKELQRKDQATKEMVIRIQKYYFNTYFNEFDPKIFHKLYCNNHSKYIIDNLYAEKNNALKDLKEKDIKQASHYAEFIRHRSSKLYYIQECNKLLNIEHSNVEVESISIDVIEKVRKFVIKNIKNIQIAFNMKCSREFDIIKNIYSKWSGTIIKCIEKGKQKRPDYYQITQPEINKNLYDKLKLKIKLDGKCHI